MVGIRAAHCAASAAEISRCSGAIRLAMSHASSMLRTTISAPRSASDVAMTSLRRIAGSSFAIDAATRSANDASG